MAAAQACRMRQQKAAPNNAQSAIFYIRATDFSGAP
jgi:hypothetical protein